jgi:hypothetical protein
MLKKIDKISKIKNFEERVNKLHENFDYFVESQMEKAKLELQK